MFKKKIIFLSTPFDNKSAFFLNKINVPCFKISSADIDNFHLLKFIKKFKKPIILSTGMSNETKIIKTIKFLKLNSNKLAILHCIGEYPTNLKNTNLGFVKKLKNSVIILEYPTIQTEMNLQ